MSKSILSLTDAALTRVKQILQNQAGAQGLVLGLKKGGCAGMEYSVDIAYEKPDDADRLEQGGVCFFIKRDAFLYLLGTEIDYQETKLKSGFVFNNPNQTASCGCGESVSLTKASGSV
ncbi:iron-sulfur cluster assembly accessory protein [Bartonella sp. TP]|uniref:HesB/IscA family protein n=1 Tax=Bartonella sp. TP TaxID=3057550 RepID=UPI0025B189BA|nr:iron-sulfur cluster assembly accessory protein [Bartonella sp. TP]MDN5248833.1 iron-sulfur cluster assembly accessory protein [Alphaproteobacteria bacterium]MDN5248927.1 iron-sulfur cluster assembly accessory protein [Alphaproteobacteria bacterium]WJW80079.1 iron-sulfur cluster assembly accessory protein [Bartonella sp. TP]